MAPEEEEEDEEEAEGDGRIRPEEDGPPPGFCLLTLVCIVSHSFFISFQSTSNNQQSTKEQI